MVETFHFSDAAEAAFVVAISAVGTEPALVHVLVAGGAVLCFHAVPVLEYGEGSSCADLVALGTIYPLVPAFEGKVRAVVIELTEAAA